MHHFDENNINTNSEFKESFNNIFRLKINENNKFKNELGA